MAKARLRLALVIALVGSLEGAALARAEGITTEQGDAILDELQQIRRILERPHAAPSQALAPLRTEEKVSLELAPGDRSLGRSDAPVTLVEYTDYQCPFCRQFHITAFEEIKQNYIDTGKLRYVSRNFPLAMHENARGAAVAGRCAADQGQFWEMRHVMIVNATQLKPENLITYASDLRLDLGKFRNCLETHKYRADVDRSLMEGQAIGVTGTPSFVLGRSGSNKVDGVRLVGAMPYAVFDSKLKELLPEVPTK